MISDWWKKRQQNVFRRNCWFIDIVDLVVILATVAHLHQLADKALTHNTRNGFLSRISKNIHCVSYGIPSWVCASEGKCIFCFILLCTCCSVIVTASHLRRHKHTHTHRDTYTPVQHHSLHANWAWLRLESRHARQCQ